VPTDETVGMTEESIIEDTVGTITGVAYACPIGDTTVDVIFDDSRDNDN